MESLRQTLIFSVQSSVVSHQRNVRATRLVPLFDHLLMYL